MDRGFQIVQSNLAGADPTARAGYLAGINESKRKFFDHIKSGHYAAALSTALPFPDETFDFVFSINCLTHGLDRDPQLLPKVFDEATRVLKTGGELQVYPILGKMPRRIKENHSSAIRRLKDKGFNVSVDYVSSSNSRLVVRKY